ncbi:hypothetical protein MASR1M74_10650 [Lentimicrobium sp.]
MKTNKLPLLIVATLLIFVLNPLFAQTVYNVSMGNSPAYPNEVYFSLDNGEVKTVARNTWDIAFYTAAFSAGIITNDGANVGLWAYPHAGIEGWGTFDTTNMQSWTKLYNDNSEWENGSFNLFSKGHPDYGWGIYSMSNHNVVGDSLYLIKPLDGVYRKLHMVKKISTENKFVIRYAHIDGSDEHTDTLDVAPYTDRLFMAFSFTNGIIDREPPKDEWDLLFTRYYDSIMGIPYPVNGILVNRNLTVAEISPVAPDYTDWSTLDFSNATNSIGHDWKSFNMGTFQWDIADSLAYFIQKKNGAVTKLVFEAFSGSAGGTTTFNLTKVSSTGLAENRLNGLTLYPNPALEKTNLRGEQPFSNANITLSDPSGRVVKQLFNVSGSQISLDTYNLAPGIYLLHVEDSQQYANFKLIIGQ